MEEKETSVTIGGFTEDDPKISSCMSNDTNVTIGIKFTKENQSHILGFSDGDYKLFHQLISTMSLEKIKNKKCKNDNKMKCPSCKKEVVGRLALSRKDNKTQLCSECGMREGLSNIEFLSPEGIEKIIEMSKMAR